MRVLLTVAYDGANYAGWQRQDNALAVQEVLEDALSAVLGTRTRLTGASRTDAGVHALGQRAAFTAEEVKIPPDKLPRVINRWLADDIAVTKAEQVPDGFHPRFDAVEKTYRYVYRVSEFPNPLDRRAWHYPHGLDASVMSRAAADFLGRHDFAAFCASGSAAKTTVREIYECRVEENHADGTITLLTRGNAFLYNMVRIMAGTLAYIGRGKLPADSVPGIIRSKDRTKAGITAPPHGLTLVSVKY